MDKIKALLVKAGCKAELVDQICESMANYKNTIRERCEQEFAAKIEEAKKVCLEETESHKRDLTRRVRIFCETKSAAMDAQIAKKSAHSETAAESRLVQIKNLLEGIEPSGVHNGPAAAELQKAKKQLQIAKEEKARAAKAVDVANRQTAIAEKALKYSRALAAENAKLKQQLESVAVNVPRTRRLDESRQAAQRPRTTRPTLVEHQDRRAARTPSRQPSSGFGISDIAQSMDD